MPPEKPRRLGRGLDALFGSSSRAVPAAPEEAADTVALREIPIAAIEPNPYQPRKDFQDEEQLELRNSMASSGLLQPISVRRTPGESGHYQLIAGERRLRSAVQLGWKTIAAVIRDLDSRELLATALIENLQRADLNPVEEAEGYARLVEEFGHTQQTVATMVGKKPSTIANMLRLLKLPDTVLSRLRAGALSAGQVRPLLALESAESIILLAKEIESGALSARDVERRVNESTTATSKSRRGRPRKSAPQSSELKAIEDRLRSRLQTDVSIRVTAGNRGSLNIAFYSADDLARLTELLGVGEGPH